MNLLKTFPVIRLLIFCILIISICGCKTKETIPLTVKQYHPKDIGILPDSCFTIELDMAGSNADLTEIEYYNKSYGELNFYSNYDSIITVQSYLNVFKRPIKVDEGKRNGVIVKIKIIDGKFKAFYIRWLTPLSKVKSIYALTDTSNIATNLSIKEIQMLLPGFRGKIHENLNDTLYFDFNNTFPIKDLRGIKYKGEK